MTMPKRRYCAFACQPGTTNRARRKNIMEHEVHNYWHKNKHVVIKENNDAREAPVRNMKCNYSASVDGVCISDDAVLCHATLEQFIKDVNEYIDTIS